MVDENEPETPHTWKFNLPDRILPAPGTQAQWSGSPCRDFLLASLAEEGDKDNQALSRAPGGAENLGVLPRRSSELLQNLLSISFSEQENLGRPPPN